MALQQDFTLAGGITAVTAYLRVDSVTLNHKQTIVANVCAYKDADQAAAKNPLAPASGYSFPWPTDGDGAPVAVSNPQALAYTELKKLDAFAGAADV